MDKYVSKGSAGGGDGGGKGGRVKESRSIPNLKRADLTQRMLLVSSTVAWTAGLGCEHGVG
jgi:hypothetical protein